MIKFFEKIRSTDIVTCGGKWASLGELMRAWLPFADGFVLTTLAYQKSQEQWKRLVFEAFDSLNTSYVAVRSSATKEDGIDDSFAGQFATFLFVTKEQLVDKILSCRNSLNSERIATYCEEKKIERSSIKIAVVIQKMIHSEVSGVCFTADPVSWNTRNILIEAWYGLGESIVSGMITPDQYLLNKSSKNILSKTISYQEKQLLIGTNGGTVELEVDWTIAEEQKLSDDKIIELTELALIIESHYEQVMDIEWALENWKFYILQARPITTV